VYKLNFSGVSRTSQGKTKSRKSLYYKDLRDFCGLEDLNFHASRHQHICLDAGYAGGPALEIVGGTGFYSRVRGRGRERAEKTHNPAFKARRWAVEAAHSWMNRFRKILIRFEKLTVSYMGLLMFACAFIAFRKANVI
jgi:transposase